MAGGFGVAAACLADQTIDEKFFGVFVAPFDVLPVSEMVEFEVRLVLPPHSLLVVLLRAELVVLFLSSMMSRGKSSELSLGQDVLPVVVRDEATQSV